MNLSLVSLFLDRPEGSIKNSEGTSWSNQVMTVTIRDGGIC